MTLHWTNDDGMAELKRMQKAWNKANGYAHNRELPYDVWKQHSQIVHAPENEGKYWTAKAKIAVSR